MRLFNMSYFNVSVLFEQKDGFCTTFAFGVFILIPYTVYGWGGNDFHEGPLAERTKIRAIHSQGVM